jgi:acyl carrier protein
MHDLAPKIIAILQKYTHETHAAIDAASPLSALEIDELDLPMIFLDIEDAFDVQISYAVEADDNLTVGNLLVCLADCIESKRHAHSQPVIRRTKRNWMSTGADR